MPNPLPRRSAFAFLTAAASAATLGTLSLRVAAAPLIEGGEPVAQGYGRCSACACPGYAGNYNVCQNCGHNYATHW